MSKVTMRKIQLPAIQVGSVGGQFKYADNLVAALSHPKNKHVGVNYAEMCVVLPIMRKVKSAGDSVILTEAEFNEVCDRLKTAVFTTCDEIIYTFIESILSSPEVTMHEDSSQNTVDPSAELDLV